MILEAQLLVMAEQVLAEVLGRIRPQDGDIELPALHEHAPAASMSDAVARHLRADALLADALAGVMGVGDGTALVDGGGGPEPARDLLVRATLERCLLAHYVAAYLGSTACPLPEELARPLWELTSPDAAAWRARGYFRAPMPLPDHVSWRDRFLLSAGHPPHPLGH